MRDSFVRYQINLTSQITNKERPCTTFHQIMKKPSTCQSLLSPGLVNFPALSQIKPQAPRLVVSFRQFL